MNKTLFLCLSILIPIYFVLSAATSWADTTIVLQDGEEYEGHVIQQTGKIITLKTAGGDYYLPVKDIKTVNGDILQATGRKLILSRSAEAEDIQRILEHLGYPDKKRAEIEKEVALLLKKIDFPRLKKEAAQVKSDPRKLKDFVVKLGGLIEKDGYTDTQSPPLILKLLTTSFVDDNLSQEVMTSSISFGQKVESIKALVACTAISQLGSIVLDMLGINVKVAFSPGHVFNYIPLNARRDLFVDFSNQLYEIVDINQYYLNLGSRTKLLKDQYHISPERLIEIKAQLPSELQSDSLEEILNFLYLYVYMSDDYATTPAIYLNLANIHSRKGEYGQAIFYYNQAIALNPEYAEAYHGRGITYGNEGHLTQALADLNEAIELFPEFAEAYHDRGNMYGARGDIDDAIADFNQAIIIDPDYTKAYLDRGAMYSNKGDLDQAISDYNKAIGIDPYFADAYKSRAEAYYSKQEYDKSWADVHKVEDFGDDVNLDLVDKLKKASDSKHFATILILAPILVLLIFLFFK